MDSKLNNNNINKKLILLISYMIPVYERGEYILKLLPPAGWSFEPSQIELNIDGETDPCTLNHDLNFVFKGFGLAGRVC
jgi:hypothetical protein